MSGVYMCFTMTVHEGNWVSDSTSGVVCLVMLSHNSLNGSE